MSDLKSRASAARSGQPVGNGRGNAQSAPESEPIIFEVGQDPEAVPVAVAWARVMRFCRALPKGSKAEIKDRAGKFLYSYQYRGIDDVISLAGAALREIGVMTVPISIKLQQKALGQMNSATVDVTYRTTSLGEGEIIGVSMGEGLDMGDKAIVKALTQSYRTYMITALSLPTYDLSLDSDATPVLRPEPPGPFEIRDEILSPKTSLQRLVSIQGELREAPDMAATAVPVGDHEVRLWDLVVETRKGRAEAMDRIEKAGEQGQAGRAAAKGGA